MIFILKSKKLSTQSFTKGVISLIFSQIVIKFFGLIYKLYLTNKDGFGDSGNAIYSSGFQIYALLLTMSSIGVPNAVAKMISSKISIGDKKEADRIFRISFLTFSIIGFFCSLILFTGANYIANNLLQIPEAKNSLIALSPAIFFVSVISVIRGYFNGMQNMSATANSQTIEQILKTIFTICFVEFASNISECNTCVMAAAGNLATTFATFGCFFYLLKFYFSRKNDINLKFYNTKHFKQLSGFKIIKDIICVTIPISLTSILISINKNVDSITVVRGLKQFLSAEEAKLQYGILSGKVDTLVSFPLSFNMAFSTALVPAVSGAFAKKNNNEGLEKIAFSLLITILISLPSSIGICAFSDKILDLLFPNAHSGSFVLKIAALSILFTSLSQTINGALQGIGKVFIPAISLSIGVMVKFILNLILVPISTDSFILGGVRGAALSTVICHIIAFTISFSVLKKYTKINLDLSKYVLKPVLATLIMVICLYCSNSILIQIINKTLSTLLSIIISCIFYILAIFLLKIFSKEDIGMLPFFKNFIKL